MLDRVLDPVQRLSAVGAVLGLEILRELGDGDLVDARRDDAPLDRGALALLQQAPGFLVLGSFARLAAQQPRASRYFSQMTADFSLCHQERGISVDSASPSASPYSTSLEILMPKIFASRSTVLSGGSCWPPSRRARYSRVTPSLAASVGWLHPFLFHSSLCSEPCCEDRIASFLTFHRVCNHTFILIPQTKDEGKMT